MELRAIIEIPRGGFIKRELHEGHRIEFISPVPCPFNYGFLPGRPGADGDPVDALILGPRLAIGSEVRLPRVAVVEFVDGGLPDPKWVLSRAPLRPGERRLIRVFFRVYAQCRRAMNRLKGIRGETRYLGLRED